MKEGYDYDAIVTAWTDDAGQKLFYSYTLQDFDSLITLRQQNRIASKSYLNSGESKDGDGSTGAGKENKGLSSNDQYSYSTESVNNTKQKFSVDDVNIIDLTKDNELSRRIGKTKGSGKYKKALHRQLK